MALPLRKYYGFPAQAEGLVIEVLIQNSFVTLPIKNYVLNTNFITLTSPDLICKNINMYSLEILARVFNYVMYLQPISQFSPEIQRTIM